MRSFVDQVGAPVLTVRSSCSQNTSDSSSRSAASWARPARHRAADVDAARGVEDANGQTRYELIDRPERTIKVEGAATFANADSRGYYFTDYTADTVGQFAKNPPA